MKINHLIKNYFLLAFAIFFTYSCGKNNQSRGTGWSINSKKGGFQYNTDFDEQETGPGLVFIEGGTYTKGQVQDDVMHDWNNSPNQQHVMSFYIDETEVTNIMYLEYLDWIKQTATTAYHPCGTCKIGEKNDPSSVVQNDCKVKGFSNLYLADSSIFPQICNGNLNAPSIMTGEKASDHILGKPLLAPSNLQPYTHPNWQNSQK